jgi:hypothetical protein
MTGTKTPGAQIETLRSAVDVNGGRLDIRLPRAGRMLLGVTYSISKLDLCSTKIACLSQGNLQLLGNVI